MSETSVARNAGRMSVAVMISRVLGLVREQIFAYFFGAGLVADAYLVAFRVPNLFRDLFAEGALSSAFVTVFARSSSETRSRELARNVMAVITLVVGAVCIALYFMSPGIVAYIAGDFASEPGKLELTTELTKIMVPFLYLASSAALAMGILNSLGSFFVPSMGSAAFNLGSIVVGGGLAYYYRGHSPVSAIYGFTWGTLVGGFLQWSVQWPAMMEKGYRPLAGLRILFSRAGMRAAFADSALRDIARLMAPAILSVASVQINVLVNTYHAAALEQGSVSWLSFAFRIMHFPMGVFGVALSTATLPRLSKLIFEKDHEGFSRTLEESLKWTIILAVGSTAGLIVFRDPIVSLLYERGHFNAHDTLMTGNSLAAFAIGLLAYNGTKIFVQAFYALNNIWVPTAVSLLSIILNYSLNVYFSKFWGPAGLALSTAVTAFVTLGLLMYFLRRKKYFHMSARLGKVLLASLIGGAAIAALGYFGLPAYLYSLRAKLGTLLFAMCLMPTVGAAGLLYMLLVSALSTEGRALLQKLRGRVGL